MKPMWKVNPHQSKFNLFPFPCNYYEGITYLCPRNNNKTNPRIKKPNFLAQFFHGNETGLGFCPFLGFESKVSALPSKKKKKKPDAKS